MKVEYLGEYEDQEGTARPLILCHDEINILNKCVNIAKRLGIGGGTYSLRRRWEGEFGTKTKAPLFVGALSHQAMADSAKFSKIGHKLDMAILAMRINMEIKNEAR